MYAQCITHTHTHTDTHNTHGVIHDTHMNMIVCVCTVHTVCTLRHTHYKRVCLHRLPPSLSLSLFSLSLFFSSLSLSLSLRSRVCKCVCVCVCVYCVCVCIVGHASMNEITGNSRIRIYCTLQRWWPLSVFFELFQK